MISICASNTINGKNFISVSAPYNTIFIDEAKKLGGKWIYKKWEFDAREEQRVRELCMNVYGMNGIASDVCTVKISFNSSDYASAKPICIAGRPIASATGRDSGASLGDGVILLSGGFKSGGSIKNWTTEANDNTVVLVHDFPRQKAKKLIEAGKEWISIEPEATPIDNEALEKEKEMLLKRLEEINKLIQ